jgi:hypothetical protein
LRSRINQLSLPLGIDLGVDVKGSEVEDEGGKGESEDEGFKGNKAAKESMIAGVVSGVEWDDAEVGGEAALVGVTPMSEGISARLGDLAGVRICFADDGDGWERLNAESLSVDFGSV